MYVPGDIIDLRGLTLESSAIYRPTKEVTSFVKSTCAQSQAFMKNTYLVTVPENILSIILLEMARNKKRTHTHTHTQNIYDKQLNTFLLQTKHCSDSPSAISHCI